MLIGGGVTVVQRRSPHGERGLKYLTRRGEQIRPMSLSSRRAWIEISIVFQQPVADSVALLTESVD